MPRAGEIRVDVRKSDLLSLSSWLVTVRIPVLRGRPDTLLGAAGHNSEWADQLEAIAGVLQKAAARRRLSDEFTVNLQRAHVAALVAACDAFTTQRHTEILAALRKALRARRGRPGLTPPETATRQAGTYVIDERHKKRLAARERKRQRWDEWLEEGRRQRKTLLGRADPPPEI
jgi:hypothetical protein